MARDTIKEEAAAEDIRTRSERKSITGCQVFRKDAEGILGTGTSQRFNTVAFFEDFALSGESQCSARHSCRAFTLKVTQCHPPLAHGSSKP